jgi:predicted DNA-binding transcriptional regulator AlpA
MVDLDNRWLSVDEICKHLGVSKDTVYKWMEQAFPPPFLS